jgi:arthrofactin-type cyclic lipopeptide synthetase C
MSSPHVETVGAAISTALELASHGDDRPTAPGFAALMSIQTGRRRMAPVVCVPGAGGNVASFVDLAATLGDDYTVYGLQPRGLAEGEVPHSDVAVMAASYVRAIVAEYPQGPMHLLGHSFGGCVVFEMAQQLCLIGRAPVSVTVVDGELPAVDAVREFSDIDAFLQLTELFEMNSGCSLGIQPDALAALLPSEQLSLLHARLVNASIMPRSSLVSSLGCVFKTFSSHLRTSYIPRQIFGGEFNLVLVPDHRLSDGEASKQMYETEQRWRCWAPRLEVWHGPGNHITILRQPQVAALAGRLRRKLRG